MSPRAATRAECRASALLAAAFGCALAGCASTGSAPPPPSTGDRATVAAPAESEPPAAASELPPATDTAPAAELPQSAPPPPSSAPPPSASAAMPPCVPASQPPKPHHVRRRKPPAPPQDSQSDVNPAPPEPPDAPIDAQVGESASPLASILGKKVQSLKGDDLGRVVDVLADADGRVRAAVIDFGGFLGVGTRHIAVDWPLLRFNPAAGDKAVILNVSRDKLQSMPEFKDPNKPKLLMPPSGDALPDAATNGNTKK
jgi:hypothetical protein